MKNKMKNSKKLLAIGLTAVAVLSVCAVTVNASDLAGNATLIVTEITPNCDYLFANEGNEICAKIENNGTGAADAFNVSFDIGVFTEKVRVDAGLAAGENITKYITDPTSRNAGESVTITVTADCDDEVTESNETNNVLTQDATVVNNGYKGKRYTGGEDITTWKTLEFNGNMLFSFGDSYYLSGATNWTQYTANWTASNLSVPAGATIVEARLYMSYTWDKSDAGNITDYFSMNLNNVTQTLDAHYTDRKGYGSYNYPYGTLVYDVTADFNASGNTANLTNSYLGGGNVSMRGMGLGIVYANDSEPLRMIIVNEGFDLLYGSSAQCTTPEEATAYAPFEEAIDTSNVASATLTTLAPGASGPEGDLIFNGQVIETDVWNFTTDAEIGIDVRDVTAYLNTTNEAGFRSDGDYMEASTAVLVVEYAAEVVAPAEVVINEFVAEPNVTQTTEWIELYNPTDSEANLTGWTLKDGANNTLADLSGKNVTPDGYLLLDVSGNKLNNAGDLIELRNNTNAIVDNVAYGNWDDGNLADNAPVPGKDNSTGRYPNGQDIDVDKDDFVVFTSPTPGVSNGVPEDTTPPEITNLQPADGSFINDTTPTISANYSDPSGINVSSVEMRVDGNIVTPDSVTETGVSYTSATDLSEGLHNVTVNVSDNAVSQNTNSTSWSFTVDVTEPTIEFVAPTPVNESTNTTGYVNFTVNVTDPVPSSGLDIVNISVWNETGIYLDNETMHAFDEHEYYYNAQLPNGNYTYKVYAKDIAGNMGVSKTRAVTVNKSVEVKGDFDGDGNVDFDDFVEFAGAYGATTCTDPNYNSIADFDDDCDVDFDDFVEFAGVYTG